MFLAANLKSETMYDTVLTCNSLCIQADAYYETIREAGSHVCEYQGLTGLRASLVRLSNIYIYKSSRRMHIYIYTYIRTIFRLCLLDAIVPGAHMI